MSNETIKNGRWVEKTDYEVKGRIEKIDETVSQYRSLSSGISSLISSIKLCSENLKKSYNLAQDAIVIEDSGFNQNLSNIGKYSNNMENIASGLSVVSGKIGDEIQKLEVEKASLLPRLTYKVWVEN